MVEKRVLCPQRLRRVPQQFSLVDQRLVRDNYLRGLSAESLALYLFLVTVSDAQGLSYYSDAAIAQHLGCICATLERSRMQLCKASLIAYQRPLYQVLSLQKTNASTTASRPSSVPRTMTASPSSAVPASVAQILRGIIGGGE